MNEMLENALDKVTIEMLMGLEYGDEIELNEEYTLYHYTDDDLISVFKTEEWDELFAVLYSEKTKEIVFEAL